MAETQTSDPQVVEEPLTRHHRELEQLFRAVAELAHGGDARSLGQLWNRFDRIVRAHIGVEEEELLPLFRVHHPDEAELIAREHVELLRLLDQIGIDVDLHLLREPIADELLERLRAHARREEVTMYPWAERSLPYWREALTAAFDADVLEPAPKELLAELQTLLDDVRLRLHLGRMEARDAYADIARQASALGANVAQSSKSTARRLLTRLRSLSESLRDPAD